jgi:hypothetical protein
MEHLNIKNKKTQNIKSNVHDTSICANEKCLEGERFYTYIRGHHTPERRLELQRCPRGRLLTPIELSLRGTSGGQPLLALPLLPLNITGRGLARFSFPWG